ncbi:MAG: hypothetical protein RJA70_3299, partial [Pseudomonadota bacterium]
MGTSAQWVFVLACVAFACSNNNGSDPATDAAAAEGGSNGEIPDGGRSADAAAATVWQPKVGTSWQWQLSGGLEPKYDVAMYDVDLVNTTDLEFAGLRADGRIVICYFSAGTVEDYRDDAKDFAANDIGKPLPEWPDEKWVDVRSAGVRKIMQKRLDLAVTRGCDGVEPDNVDGYANDNGLALEETDQVDYNRFLARESHARGLSVGLKNAVSLAALLEPDFDWALNEECLAFDECSLLRPFISARKPVF